MTTSVTEYTGICALPMVRRVAALLDLPAEAWIEGDPLPRGWHFILGYPETPQSELRADGLGSLTVPLPESDLPYLVMGGKKLTFFRDIPIGAAVTRMSRIASITPKRGQRGRMLIVSVLSELVVADDHEPAVVETQDFVMLETEGRGPLPRPETASHRHDLCVTVVPDASFLFRYSAITFNAHRIHYDRPYAVEVEGFPALVVNGGLTHLLLAQLFRQAAEREPVSISMRNRLPLFCGVPMHLFARREGATWQLWAENDEGALAVEGTVE